MSILHYDHDFDYIVIINVSILHIIDIIIVSSFQYPHNTMTSTNSLKLLHWISLTGPVNHYTIYIAVFIAFHLIVNLFL